MPPGLGIIESCCLPTEYPNYLTLRGLLQHKFNAKLGAPVMLRSSTCRPRPSVWPLQRHRLHRPSHQTAIHHSTYCMRRIFRQCPTTSPHSTVTDRRWHRVMHLKTSVSQTPTRQAANATPSYNLPYTNENHPDTVINHRPALSRRLSRRRSAGHTGTGKRIVDLCWDPIDYVLLFSYGTDGFHLDIPKDGKAKSVTEMECYCWQLMQRDGQALTSCCAATWNSSG